ncbi:unnamed protein product [Phaeothamnion confervicola]
MYVPTEQVGIIVGKAGAMVQNISRETDTKIVTPRSEGLLWSKVLIKGDPTGTFEAFERIEGMVDGEVWACGCTCFHLPQPAEEVGCHGFSLLVAVATPVSVWKLGTSNAILRSHIGSLKHAIAPTIPLLLNILCHIF